MKRIGVLGNGQLGRLLILKGHEMGFNVLPFGPDKASPAAQVCPQEMNAAYEDEAELKTFAEHIDIATVEFENIPLATLEFLAQRVEVHPSPEIVWVCQNRSREKEWLKKNGFPIVPVEWVTRPEDLLAKAKKIQFPLVIKTTGFGYDGKGQTRINEEKDLSSFEWKADSYVIEKWLTELKEGSVIVAQNETETSCLGPFENRHAHHILDTTHFPSQFPLSVQKEMLEISRNIAKSFQLKGILCVEFFIEGSKVYVNEMAPRPHNSGHLTIEAFQQSQFEQHLRSIAGLPLGQNRTLAPGAAMANLLGDLWKTPRVDLPSLFQSTDAQLHWYGKQESRKGRKMGHLTAIAPSPELALKAVITARNSIVDET